MNTDKKAKLVELLRDYLPLPQWNIRIYAFLIPLTLLSGCITAPAPIKISATSAPRQPIPAPHGIYFRPIWLDENLIVAHFEQLDKNGQDTERWTNQIWQMHPDGTGLQVVSLPTESAECLSTEFRPQQALPDHRLLFSRVCGSKKYDYDSQRVMIWDPRNDTSELVRDYKLPPLVVEFSFLPDLSKGILGTDTGIVEDLYWLDASQSRHLDFGFARATYPAWSPNGREIVFFGNQRKWDNPGAGWAARPYDLWRVTANCEELLGGSAKVAKVVLTNILNQLTVNWSPDGEWIVFDGDLQQHGHGIWLYHVLDEQVVQVLSGDYNSPSWSPDGTHLVVVGPPPGSAKIDLHLTGGNSLYILDVSQIVQTR